MKRNLLIPAGILLFLFIGTILVVLYGKGYRLSFQQEVPKISKTGMLVANSEPKGAQVFIEDHLTTATDNTLNLDPGTYNIKIQKEGYFSWQKKIKIEAEVVTNIDAKLLASAPRLESIATTSIINPIIDPSRTKIAYQISSESAVRKNGIFVLNMNTNPIPVPVLTLQSSSTQIADDTADRFSEANISWSPDGTEILAQISTDQGITTYRLQSDRFNENPQDVTAILDSVHSTWDKQKQQKEKNFFAGIKNNMHQLINKNFSILLWSPDGEKILYTASTSAELPLMINPRRLSINTLIENRKITQDKTYVYDTKEDTNIPLPVKLTRTCPEECTTPLAWLPDSSHLLYINDKKIIIMDDDGSNNITVYAGPFVDNFAVPWPDNSKIVILTNLGNPNTSPTFYTIGLN